jgi:hypothetical protein
VIDAIGIEKRRAALYAMNDVALLQKKFGQVSAVLAGDTRYERNLWFSQGFVYCLMTFRAAAPRPN